MWIMMQEVNKYYTPSIEEFYEGFEFETNNCFFRNPENEKWDKIVCNTSIINVIKYDLLSHDLVRHNSIRVKILDQEDIESLEWEFGIKTPFRMMFTGNEKWFNNTIPDSKGGRYWGFRLLYDFNRGTVKITAKTNDGESEYETFYNGFCKNKSELKRIMKKLNIIN